jgi:hypothetical protein
MREAEGLQRIVLSLRDSLPEEAVILHKGIHDWHNEADRFYAWYYRAVQLMTESGFAGLAKFQTLCEDGEFSVLDFYTTLALGRKPADGWRDQLYARLSQMHFILGALPVAVKSANERNPRGMRPVSILDRLGDLSEV